MITVDDPTLRDLLSKHQEGMAGATVLSLFASVAYAVFKQFDWRHSLQAAGIGALLSSSGYLFLAEWLHLGVFFVVPIGLGAGFGAYPLLRAYTQRDGSVANWVLDKLGLKTGDKP